MTARVDNVITSGQFCLDGGCWDVDNNVWLIGDDREVLVIDAPHRTQPIVDAIAGRNVSAIVLTHGHNDHINAAVELEKITGAPIWFPPADRMLWDEVYDSEPQHDLVNGTEFRIAGITIKAIATPGHSPGSTCLYARQLNTVFTGDTLFRGGPGATGRSYSDHDTIVDSIRTRLLTLPADTVVCTGHGDSTMIGAEAANVS